MTFRLYTFTVLLFLFAAKAGIAQPGGGGGLYIMKLYDGNKKLIEKNNPYLKVQQFILSKKKKPKEYTREDWLYDYRNVDTTVTHIYIPSVIKKGSGRQYLPDERLLLIFHNDTMVVDLVGMKRPNAGAYVDVMEKIEFKPGYFRCLRDPYQQLPNYIAHPQQNEMRKLLDCGLTDSTLDRLVHFGLLQYRLKTATAGQYNNYEYTTELAQQADSLINIFVMSPYPPVKENSFWVHDEKMQPLQHAVISWSNNTVTGEVKQGDNNGIYIIPKLDDGLYKVIITAEGYEPQTQYIQASHNAVVRRKIALGKTGGDYIYFYTLFGAFPCKANSFNEYVSFVNKKPMPPPADTFRMKQFEKEIQDAIGSITILDDNLNTPPFIRCIPWPADGKERAHFRKQVEESDVIKTNAMYIRECGGVSISPDVIFHISAANIKETTLRRTFKNSGFDILQSSIQGPVNNEAPYWKIAASYTLPLSLDFLRTVNTIAINLPVLFIQISHTIAAEPSTNRN